MPDFSYTIDAVIFFVNAFYLLADLTIKLLSLTTFFRMQPVLLDASNMSTGQYPARDIPARPRVCHSGAA